MDDLQPYMSAGTGGMLPYGQDYRQMRKTSTGREILRTQNAGLVRSTAVDVEATLASMKVQAVGSVGRSAQSEVAMLCQTGSALVQACGNNGWAARQIENITQATVVGMATTIMDTVNTMRRI